MIDHVSIGVRDVAKTKRFYDAALKPLGYQCLSEGEGSLGYGRGTVALWISAAEHPGAADMQSGLHFCFTAPTPNSVDAFHAAALATGDGTTACPASAPTTVQAITRPSSLIPTATGSKRTAVRRSDLRKLGIM